MKKYLLFDLDGTLTDPKVGITSCVQYALKSFGIEEPDLDKLEPFIGPPLKESFMEFYQMSEEDAWKAVEKYRERFTTTGLFENEVYEGIPQMLHTLQSKGLFLAVASSKPTVYVEQILEHFNLSKYFKVVVGSELDGTRVNKDEVVEEALKRLFGEAPIDHKQVYMIGDRKFDIEGAKALNVESVGVSYGYGGVDELKEAKADYIVRSVDELKEFLLRGVEEALAAKKRKRVGIWDLAFPFLMFIIVKKLAFQFLELGLLNISETLTGPLADFLIYRDETGVVAGYTGNALNIIGIFSFIVATVSIWKIANLMIRQADKEMKLSHLKPEPKVNYVILGVMTIGAALGINLLLILTNVMTIAEVPQSMFWIGIVFYGIVAPIAEEILFRGIIFNYTKRMFKLNMAIIISSLLFGVYHGNYIQGIYGFILGCLMAYAYEYFGNFYVPVAIHIGINLLAYSLGNIVAISNVFLSWPVCILCLVLAVGGMIILNKKKRII